jgi:DNA-binding transcriptional LysR family regulator
MDVIENLRAYLAVARTGSFSGAARELHVAASVVTKRISQLEWRLKSTLFERTTRRVSLTTAGQLHLIAIQRLVSDLDGIFGSVQQVAPELQGRLRIKAPSSLTVLHLAALFNTFQQRHPLVSLELVALDRAVNPVDEGFDIALTLMPDTFGGVIEEPLCAVRRLLVAAPAYLQDRGVPQKPSDLAHHHVLNFVPTGNVLAFESATGALSVSVRPRFSSNEAQLVEAAAVAGNGVAVLGDYLALPAMRAGTLVQVLADYPMPELWLKALIPENRAHTAHVRAMLEALRSELAPAPPWSC